MTPERLARLRFLASFAAYHVPSPDSDPSNMMDAEAGDDMLELCDAAAVVPELLDGATALLAALQPIYDAGHFNPATLAAYKSLARAIAKAEGRS